MAQPGQGFRVGQMVFAVFRGRETCGIVTDVRPAYMGGSSMVIEVRTGHTVRTATPRRDSICVLEECGDHSWWDGMGWTPYETLDAETTGGEP